MVYSTRQFVVCLSLCHFVLVFFSHFSIAITSLGEERVNFVLSYLFSVCACVDLSVSSSSWGLGMAAVCDCGTPWTFFLHFFLNPGHTLHRYCLRSGLWAWWAKLAYQVMLTDAWLHPLFCGPCLLVWTFWFVICLLIYEFGLRLSADYVYLRLTAYHSADYVSFPLGSLDPLWYIWKWSSAHVYARGRKQCCKFHYCLWRVSIKPSLPFSNP